MRFEGFIQFGNIWVIQFLHNFHFPFNGLSSVWFHQFDFFINLYRDLLIQNLVETKSDHSISTLADPLADNVVVKVIDSAAFSAKFLIFESRCTLHLIDLCLVKWMSFHIYHCFLSIRLGLLLSSLSSCLKVRASFCPRLGSLRRDTNLTLVQLEIVQFDLSDVIVGHAALVGDS